MCVERGAEVYSPCKTFNQLWRFLLRLRLSLQHFVVFLGFCEVNTDSSEAE